MLAKSMPPCHPYAGDSYFDSLLEPARFYRHPNDVVTDQRLSPSEKRAVLASWASDECAVDSMPTLRIAPWSPTAVTFDDVVEALQKLDRETDRQSSNVIKPGVASGSSATA